MSNRSLIRVVGVIFMMLVLTALPAGAVTKLVMLHWEGANTPLQEGIARFQELNPDIEVELISGGAYDDKIFSMHATGVDFDLMYVSADVYLDWVKKGLLKDLTPFFAKDSTFTKKNFLPIETDRVAVDGKWYGIGSSWSLFHIYYNRDMFDAAGIAPVPRSSAKAWTWDEYIKVAQKLTRSDGQKIECYGANRPVWWLILQSFLLSNDSNLLNPEGTRFLLDQPEAYQVLEAINIGINEKRVFGGAFSQKGAAMAIAGSWSTGLSYYTNKVHFTVDVGVLPKFKQPTTYAQGHIHAIHSLTKHPDEAWRLLKYFSSDEYLGVWVKNGVWLPTTMQMMTTEAFRKYHNPDVMPDGYLQFVMTYLFECGRARKMPVGWGDSLSAYEKGIAPVWSGEKPLRTALEEIVPQLNAILKEQQGF